MPRPGESFLERFHRRKREAHDADRPGETAPQPALPREEELSEERTARPELTDSDMPPIDSLTIDSDFTGFLSEKVSETLRRAALRKLFHSEAFNVVDGLDEYAEDFTTFEALGDIVTADMRHQLEVEARKKAEAIRRAMLGDDEEIQPADSETIEEDATGSAADPARIVAAQPEDVEETPGSDPVQGLNPHQQQSRT